MKLDITSFDGGTAGSVDLDDAVFGLEPRPDLLARCVRWQLAKRRAGTHAASTATPIITRATATNVAASSGAVS